MTTEELVGVNKKERLRAEVDAVGLEQLMNVKIETVAPSDTVNDVLKLMRDHDIHEVPVITDDKRLLGVVSYGTLLKRRNLSINAKVETIMIMPQKISVQTPITEVAELFLSSGYREVPVMDDDVIAGIVSRSDLLRVVREVEELRRIPVSEIMSPDVKTVKMDTNVHDAVQMMRDLEVRVLPIVDDRDHIIAIVGIKDIATFNWHQRNRQTIGELVGDSDPVTIAVGSVAVEPPQVAPPSMSLGEAATIMLERNISTLPVVEGGEIKGIVTKYDLIELLASLRQRNMVYIQISGLKDRDPFSQDLMTGEIESSMRKISPITTPMMFNLHVGVYKDDGLNYKYSLHGRLTTDDRMYTASTVDWDIVRATASLMKLFERRVIEHKEEKLEHRKRSRNIGHS